MAYDEQNHASNDIQSAAGTGIRVGARAAKSAKRASEQAKSKRTGKEGRHSKQASDKANKINRANDTSSNKASGNATSSQSSKAAEKAGKSAGKQAGKGAAAAKATGKTKTAAALAKIGSKAASFNYVGAALTLVTSDETKAFLVRLIAFVLCICMLPLMFLYSLPTVVFEALQGLWNASAESFKQSLYSGEYGDATESFWRSVWNGAGTFASGLWNKAKDSMFGGDKDVDPDIARLQSEGADASDYKVIDNEDAEADTLWKKIDATKSKLSTRSEYLSNSVANDKGVQSYYRSQASFLFSSTYSDTEDDRYVYEGCTVQGQSSVMISDAQAVRLMSLSTVQTDANIDGMQVSDYQKWLGYDTGSGVSTRFYGLLDPSYAVRVALDSCIDSLRSISVEIEPIEQTVSLIPWKGTCVPQYVYDRVNYERLYFDGSLTKTNGCAAVDLMLIINAPQSPAVSADTTETKTEWIIDEAAVTQYNYQMIGYRMAYAAYLLQHYQWEHRDDAHEADPEPQSPEQPTEPEPIEHIYTEHHISYTATITCSVRQANDLLEILGIMGTEEAKQETANEARMAMMGSGGYSEQQISQLWNSTSAPTRAEIVSLAQQKLGFSETDIAAALSWTQGEAGGNFYINRNEPYAIYLYACVGINRVKKLGGEGFFSQMAGWGGYYSRSNTYSRGANPSDVTLKAMYLALMNLHPTVYNGNGMEVQSNPIYTTVEESGRAIYFW